MGFAQGEGVCGDSPCFPSERQIGRRDARNEPHAVVGLIEWNLIPKHQTSLYSQNNGLSVPLPDTLRRIPVSGEMDHLAAARFQTIPEDRGQVVAGGAVPEPVGRLDGRQAEIDREGMTLRGPDALTVRGEAEAPLVVRLDHPLQGGEVKRFSCPFRQPDQVGHVRPALSVQRQADPFRLMSQDQGQQPGDFGILHRMAEKGVDAPNTFIEQTLYRNRKSAVF